MYSWRDLTPVCLECQAPAHTDVVALLAKQCAVFNKKVFEVQAKPEVPNSY